MQSLQIRAPSVPSTRTVTWFGIRPQNFGGTFGVPTTLGDILMGALVDQFAAAGVRFERGEVGNLRALGALTDELRTAIRTHKPAIVAELAANDAGTANPGQRQELRELIAIILARDTEAERTETLAVACADPHAALTSFRILVAELHGPWRRA